MACKAGWSSEFLMEVLDKTFINNAYKHHRENVLYEREIALLPATQPFVQKTIKLAGMKEELMDLKAQRQRMHEMIHELTRNMYVTEAELHRGIHSQSENEKTSVFIRSCPCDGCKGYLSVQWKCGICETQFCPNCSALLINTEANVHVCNDDDVATTKLLKTNTKPCPSCTTLIFKIDGCDQMFCTVCHSAFSWRSGVIEKHHIHNPHYYDWVRNNHNGQVPREPRDNPCHDGELPTIWDIDQHVKSMSMSFTMKTSYFEFYRLLGHVRYSELPRYAPNEDVNKNMKLRIDFLMNKVNENMLKKKLQQFERVDARKRAIHQILSMYFMVGCDMIKAMLTMTMSSQFDSQLEEISVLHDYTNAQLMMMSKTYDCTAPYINKISYNVVRKKYNE
jgi:hypothetical protein